MSNGNPSEGSDASLQTAQREPWQRPVLRHLAAKEARGGNNPHNDGQPGNPTPGSVNHS